MLNSINQKKLMRFGLSLMVLSLIITQPIISQESQEAQEKSFKRSKILLKTGETVKAKKLKVQQNHLSFYDPATQKENTVDLKEVENVMVSTKTAFLPGIMIGTGVGLGTMFLVESQFEKPKTTTSTSFGPGFTTTRTTTLKREMAPGYKMLIAVGGTALGSIVGALIKTGWKKVYSDDQGWSDRLTVGLEVGSSGEKAVAMRIGFQF